MNAESQHFVDALQLALNKLGYAHVEIKWNEPDVEKDLLVPMPFPMYWHTCPCNECKINNPNGLLSRVMVQICIDGRCVLESSTDMFKQVGVEKIVRAINVLMGRHDLNNSAITEEVTA